MRFMIFTLSLFCGASNVCAATLDHAPFGVFWGMTKTETQALGVILSPAANQQNCGLNASASNLPKSLADTESVILCFGLDDKLWRIVSVSKNLENDYYGAQVRSRFDTVAKLLTDRYGLKSNDVDRRPSEEYFQKSEKYAYALSQRKAVRYSEWETDKLAIELSVRAVASEATFYVVIYEYKPLRGNAEQQQRKKDQDAL